MTPRANYVAAQAMLHLSCSQSRAYQSTPIGYHPHSLGSPNFSTGAGEMMLFRGQRQSIRIASKDSFSGSRQCHYETTEVPSPLSSIRERSVEDSCGKTERPKAMQLSQILSSDSGDSTPLSSNDQGAMYIVRSSRTDLPLPPLDVVSTPLSVSEPLTPPFSPPLLPSLLPFAMDNRNRNHTAMQHHQLVESSAPRYCRAPLHGGSLRTASSNAHITRLQPLHQSSEAVLGNGLMVDPPRQIPLQRIPSVTASEENRAYIPPKRIRFTDSSYRGPRPPIKRPYKKYYSNPTPSSHCHVCARTSKAVKFAICARINDGLCRKVTCYKCFSKFGWDWSAAVSNPEWICVHCRGECPPGKSQCYIYTRVNSKRESKRGVKRAAKFIDAPAVPPTVLAHHARLLNRSEKIPLTDAHFQSPL